MTDDDAHNQCFKCDKELSMVHIDAKHRQPYGGQEFVTHGGYGSTVFDPFEGEKLTILICDDCMKAAKPHQIIWYKKTLSNEPTLQMKAQEDLPFTQGS